MTVTVPAIKEFEWHGDLVRSGDPVTVTPVEALQLYRQGKVTLDSQASVNVVRTRDMAPEPEPEPEPVPVRKRRAYKRRDLTAEQS